MIHPTTVSSKSARVSGGKVKYGNRSLKSPAPYIARGIACSAAVCCVFGMKSRPSMIRPTGAKKLFPLPFYVGVPADRRTGQAGPVRPVVELPCNPGLITMAAKSALMRLFLVWLRRPAQSNCGVHFRKMSGYRAPISPATGNPGGSQSAVRVLLKARCQLVFPQNPATSGCALSIS